MMKDPMRKFATLLGLVSILGLLALARPSGTEAASLIHGNGRICNTSGTSLFVTAKIGVDWFGNGGRWEVRQVRPQQCLGGRGSGVDVDVVWGATCNPIPRCQLQSWKLGEGSFTAQNAQGVRAPAGPVIAISGGGGWVRDSQWPSPDVNSVRYTLIVR